MSAELTLQGSRALKRAEHWIQQGEWKAAEEALAQAQPGNAGHPSLLAAEASLREKQGNLPRALALLERAAAQEPDDALLQVRLGRALRNVKKFSGALKAFERARQLAPELADAWFNLGTLLFMTGHVDKAVPEFERAHQLAPGHAATLVGLAIALNAIGRTVEAASRLREAIRLEPSAVQAWEALTNLKTIELTPAEIDQLEQLYRHRALPNHARAVAGFALADALERHRRYPDAYAVLVEANALKRRELEWDAVGFTKGIDQLMTAFSKPLALAADPQLGHEVIFIMSLPRSGSTLTEQILASHPEVSGADELRDLPLILTQESERRRAPYHVWAPHATPADWERLGHLYLERTRCWQTKPRFTDKNLATWQLLGPAKAMLPGAKFINCRRDPIETVWSCFKQMFQLGQPFSYNLDEMVAFWRDYDRMMRFWHSHYPGVVYDSRYEDLVSDPETHIRAMLDCCELPFDPACLRFHETERMVRTPSSAQVRQPLRSDTARTLRYGELLDPLREALRRAAVSETPD